MNRKLTDAEPGSASPRARAGFVVRRALLSVSDKSGVADLAVALAARGATLISTGGTAAALRDASLEVVDVADVTGAPEMLDGRVKTLHPAVHGGLLARRDDPDHMATLETRGLRPIDLLVVNLYPFQAAVAAGADPAACVEQIDIGGPAMLRAAAKNFEGVAVLTNPAQYPAFLEALSQDAVDEAYRRSLAAEAFAHTAAYDAAVADWFARSEPVAAEPETLLVTGRRRGSLRYGENPHQKAAFYARPAATGPSAATAEALQGKPLSYNNIADADAAFELVAELAGLGPAAVAIIKHANPCGAAVAGALAEAYERARAADPTSAFGGVVAMSGVVDAPAAAAISRIFTEVVVAPGFTEEARAALAAKRDLRLLATGGLPDVAVAETRVTSVRGGFLAQDSDVGLLDPAGLKIVTERAPTEGELDDMRFAWLVAKHVKSNAIVYAKDQATVGVGAGQMSRVDSTRIAARKAADMVGPNEPSAAVGSVVASDAFFPFPDGLLTAAEAGATAVIQPGGSIRDQAVIDAANEVGLAMVFTGMRHFKH